jgi:hypothetical protein
VPTPTSTRARGGAPSRSERGAHRHWRAFVIVAVVGALVLLVYDQAHLILAHSSRWANEDHALLWLGARDLGSFRFYQPNFYGQSYFTMFGAIPTELFRRAGVDLPTAGASSSVLLAISSWLVLGAAAWRRGHRVVALLAVAAPILLSTDSLLAASSAGGRDAGSFMACVGVAILLWSPRSARHVALFAAIAGLGVVWDFGSALLVVPAAAYALVLNRSDRPVLVAGAIGAVPAGAWLVMTALFYGAHPADDTYQRGDFTPRLDALWTALTHVSRYIAPAEPELARWYMIPLLVWAVITVVLVATRKAVVAVPAIVAAVAFLYALSTNKITFAVDAVYLWKGRFFLALPFLFVFLAYLVAESGIIRWSRVQVLAVVASVVVVAVATFVVRQVTLDERMAGVVSLSRKDVYARVYPVSRIEARCADLVALARRAGTDLLMFRTEVIEPYACNALYYGQIKTLTPATERRTWRLNDEERIPRHRVVVVDADQNWCDRARQNLQLGCDANTGVSGAVILDFPRQPVLPLWRRLGEPVRLRPVFLAAFEAR